MSDDESEMAQLRQSQRYQPSFTQKPQQNEAQSNTQTKEDEPKSKQDQFKQPSSDPFKVPHFPSRSKNQVPDKETLLNMQMERREQLMRDKNIQYSRHANNQDGDDPQIILGSGDISDMNLVKLQQMLNDDGAGNGTIFLNDPEDENDSLVDKRQQSVNRYKQQLREQYEEEMRRKHQNSQKGGGKSNNIDLKDQSFIPKDLGRATSKLTKMSEEEVLEVHSQHKRQKLDKPVELRNKKEFEVNLEENDDDEDNFGPSLGLFLNNREEKDEDVDGDDSRDRKRKQNDIYQKTKNVNDEENEEDGDSEIENYRIPISHEVALPGHQRAIQCIDVDQYGNRMISGGLDYILKIWDFPGMNRKLKSMREYKPFDGHPITGLSWDPDGQNFLCCTTSSSARIYDRDGGKIQTTIKGDMYIQDMSNTKGHVAALSDGHWHPKEARNFITSSLDGSLRLWDIESKTVGVDQQLMHIQLIKSFTTRGIKLPISTCSYSPNGSLMAIGCPDGSVQVFDAKAKSFHRPHVYLKDAHQNGSEVTCVKVFRDEKRLASRSMDDTMKVWDIRNTKFPINEWKDLTNFSSKTNIALSPDEKLILTGTSVRKGFGHGLLFGFDLQTSDAIIKTPISPESVTTVLWHPSINQIIVGSADTNIRILYDPKLSTRGITTSLTKLEKRKPIDNVTVFNQTILTPSIYEDEKEKEMEKDPFNPNNQNMPTTFIPPEVLNPALKKDKIRNDPLLSRKPQMPLQGPFGKGGRISGSGTYTQYIMQNLHKNDSRDQDPREALLKYAKIAEEDPQWIAPAYSKTQPKQIFDYSEIKRDNLKFLESQGVNKCPHCGLKFCQCSKKNKQ